MTDPGRPGLATVLGGTGFLGRRVVDALVSAGWGVRAVGRRAATAPADDGRRETLSADIRDPGALARAVEGASVVVNAVSLYVESGADTFHAIHVAGAGAVAAAAAAGGARLVHVSGIGADAQSASLYVRKRAAGEHAVRDACPDAVILRPSVMFGPDDAFLTTLVRLVRSAPVIPLFGDGTTRLQPVHVEDVAAAAVRADGTAPLLELGGPEAVSYRDLLRRIAARLGRDPTLLPLPFSLWRGAARAAAILPHAPVTLDQVVLMERDNVPSPDLPGLGDLGIAPKPMDPEIDRLAAG